MFTDLEYITPDNSAIRATAANGNIRIIEPTNPGLFNRASAGEFGQVREYTAPTATEAREQKRLVTRVPTVSLAIDLHAQGVLERAERAISRNPIAAIIWDKSPEVRPQGPFLEALQAEFTDDEIDAFFAKASIIRV